MAPGPWPLLLLAFFTALLPRDPSPSSWGSLVVLAAPDLGLPPASFSLHDSMSSSRGTPGLALHDP